MGEEVEREWEQQKKVGSDSRMDLLEDGLNFCAPYFQAGAVHDECE